MVNFVESLFVGALGAGINKPTFLALNITLFFAIVSLVLLLVSTWSSRPDLTPHVVFLLFLACGLWGLIIWFVSNVGLVDVEDQQREIGLTSSDDQTNDKDKNE